MPASTITALTAATIPLTGAELFPAVQGGANRKVTALQMGLSNVKALAADQSNSTVTPTKVTGLDVPSGVGTFIFEYYIRYQSAATTTGVRFGVNHSGTVTTFLWNQRWVDVLGTASSAAPDQDAIAVAGHVVGSFASRAKTTAGRGTTVSVGLANADLLMIIEGLAVVTVAGDIQLYHGSEVAAATTVKAGSSLRLTRTA